MNFSEINFFPLCINQTWRNFISFNFEVIILVRVIMIIKIINYCFIMNVFDILSMHIKFALIKVNFEEINFFPLCINRTWRNIISFNFEVIILVRVIMIIKYCFYNEYVRYSKHAYKVCSTVWRSSCRIKK